MAKRGCSTFVLGGLLIALGLVLLANNLDVWGDWEAPIWSLIFGAGGLVFLGTFITDREQWWALIPGLVLLGIAAAIFVGEQNLVPDYVVAVFVLGGIALPFLLIFLMDRENVWALIPGFTMSGIALAVLLEGMGLIGGTAMGGVIIGGISLGFLVIYLLDREQGWALFPGGILAIIALFLLAAAAIELVWPLILILLGLLLLRGNLGGRRERRRPRSRSRTPSPVPETVPSIQVPDLETVDAAVPQRQRTPTLEEQIEAVLAEEPELPEPPDPDAPELPSPDRDQE